MCELNEGILTTGEYCNPFDERYNYWMRLEHLGRYFYARDNIDKNSKVLDIACCVGYGTKIISDYCKKITGIDANKTYIDMAKEKYNNSNIEYIVQDIDYENIDGTFDYIICFETIEHVRFPNLLLQKLYNALDENGKIFLSVPNSKYEVVEDKKNKDIYHLHTFEYNEIVDMFEKNNLKALKVLGQSYTNKIVNKKVEDIEKINLITDTMKIAYPNTQDIDETYSYIFVLEKKEVI